MQSIAERSTGSRAAAYSPTLANAGMRSCGRCGCLTGIAPLVRPAPAVGGGLGDRRQLPLRKQLVQRLGQHGVHAAALLRGQHAELAVHGLGEVGAD